MSAVDELWILVAALIVLDLQAGFLALEAGMVRAKNAANVALKNLSDVCLVALAFWAVGFGLMFGPSVGGVIGLGPFLPDFDDAAFGDGFATLFVFQAAFAATAATIISGAVAERERYVGYICLSITLGAVVYPVAGHWVWAGGLMDGSEGWLQALGFVDFAGATVVHSVGGWAALVAVIALGPRLGRFTRRKRRYEAHSIAMVALGGLFLWIGWGAFNGGSAMMFDKSVGPIIGRTLLTAAAGGAAAIALSMLLYGHLRAEALINGVLAGLVAGTAGIHLFDSADSVLVGAVGAVACMAMTELLEALHIDDVVGAVPVHLGAGVWGTLAVALVVAPEALPTGDRWEQLAVQATGAAAVGLWVVSTVGLLALGLRGAGLLRASKRAEVVGLSVAENRQHSAFLELIEEMKRHQRSGSFSRRVNVERSSEIGALAHRYNRVLDRVEGEISARMNAMRSEREMRRLAEQAFDAMRKAKEESARAARRDTLTGLGNRKLLDELIDTPSRSAAGRFMVAAIDLDRFKDVNDSYGHEAGDAVLVATAQRMLTRLDEGRDFAFRIGGDEFVVLMELGPDDADPQDFCAWLLADLSEAIPYRGVALRCGGSIGYAVAEGDQPLRAALRQADLALYEAKAQGRNAARAYTPAIGAEHEEKLELANDFKAALADDQIEIVLQPQFDARTRALSGCEVLARWRHPTRGVLSPGAFMPIAEDLDLVGALDKRVLDLALAARKTVLASGVRLPELSVNVSAKRLESPDLLLELSARRDLPSQGLGFEILETAFLDSINAETQEKLNALRALGLRIEVDDFGTGHASFASVLALRPDRLKFDRMFVSGVDRDASKRELMEGLLNVARNVGAATVIEGVETATEAQTMRELGADYLQGFGLGRPMPIDEFIAWAQALEAETETRAG